MKRTEETSNVSGMKKTFLSFKASLQESFQYMKASIVGQGKKLTAKNEQEASEADLQAAKMQVDAADAAEDTKNRLNHQSK